MNWQLLKQKPKGLTINIKGGYLMDSAKIHFNNGDHIIISSDDDVFGIRSSENTASYGSAEESKKMQHFFPKSAGLSGPLPLDVHIHAGMVPSLVELFANYDFFQFEENDSVAYSCKAVTKIELL